MADSSSSASRDWRQADAVQGTSSAAKWFFTLLAVILFVVFALFFWPRSQQRTYFAAVPVKDYDPITVPRIAFSKQTVGLFKSRFARRDFRQLNLLETSASIRNLDAYLSEFSERASKDDTLILYLTAHGVSDFESWPPGVDASGPPTRVAFLLCSNYLRGPRAADNQVKARMSIRELLNEVKDFPAATKLVLLDAGHIATDPRMGMMINEFPHLVRSAVAEIDDPNLWVLVSNDLFQTSALSHGDKSSLFAYLVAEAIAKTGESGKTGESLSLAELHRQVAGGLAALGAAQSPPVPINSEFDEPGEPELDRVVYWFTPRDAEASADPDTEQGGGGANVEGPAGEDSNTASTAGAEKKSAEQVADAAEINAADPGNRNQAQQPQPAPRPESPAPVAPQSWSDAIQLAWELRDLLENRAESGGWSPIDFAPHHWRRLNAILLAYERSYDATADPSDAELRRLKEDIDDLQRLLTSMQGNQGPVPNHRTLGPIGQIIRNWNEFQADDYVKSWKDAPHDLRQALHRMADAAFHAPYYVAWHDAASITSHEEIGLRDSMHRFLQKLLEMRHCLDDKSIIDRRKKFLGLESKLRDLRLTLDQGLKDDAQAAIDDLTSAGAQSRNRILSERKVVDLLSTPLLRSAARAPLRNALQTCPAMVPPTPTELDSFRQQTPFSSGQWDRALDRARLHQDLLRQFDEPRADRIAIVLDAASGRPGDLERGLDRYAAVGQQVREAYDQLVDELNGNGRRDAGAIWRANFVDPRDVRDVEDGFLGFDRFPFEQMQDVTPPIPAKLEFVDTPTEVIRPKTDEAYTLHLPLQLAGGATPGAGDVKVKLLSYEVADIEVSVQGKTYLPGVAVPYQVSFDGPGRFDLDLAVRAKRVRNDTNRPAGGTLKVEVACRGLTATKTLRYVLPLPDWVELVVHAAGRDEPLPNADVENHVTLRPFPNRTTVYRLSLINRSDEERTVKPELIAVQRPGNAEWPRGRLFANRGLWPGVEQGVLGDAERKVLARTRDPVVLPPNGEMIPIELAVPAIEQPSAGAEQPPADTKNARPPGAATSVVTDGLVLLLGDADNSWPWKAKWIELVPAAPKDFLSVKEPVFNGAAGKVELTVRSKFGARLPADIGEPEKQITIRWSTAAEFHGVDKKIVGGIKSPEDEAALHAEVDPKHPQAPKRNFREVALAVDRYPRAFWWRVPLVDGMAVENLGESANRVGLTRIEMADYEFAYETDGQQWFKVAKDKEKMPDWVPVDLGLVAFPARQSDLAVDFEVDVRDTAANRAEISLALGQQPPQKFFDDRWFRAELAKIGAQGELEITTEVDDYQAKLKTDGAGQRRIKLQLHAEGEHADDELNVMLDGGKPTLLVLLAGDQVEFEAGDRETGIARIEWLFGAHPDLSFEKDKPSQLPFPGAQKNIRTEAIRLKADKIEPGQRCWLAARAFDLVGNQSRVEHLEFIFKPANPPADNPPEAKDLIIRGEVHRGKLLAEEGRMTVTLVELGKSQRTDAKGQFLFANVPPGTYTLKAEGQMQGQTNTGELPGVAPWDKAMADKLIRLPVSVYRPKREREPST